MKLDFRLCHDDQNDGLGGETFIRGANDGTRLRGGFSAIVDQLAQEYPLDIRLNHVVRSIEYGDEDDHVHVYTLPYVNGKEFIAKKVIISIPFGALKWDSPTCFSLRAEPQMHHRYCNHHHHHHHVSLI